ncbi:MAG: hypothetical protein WB809_07355 [Thermoplasmata archaeon]
MPVSLQMNKTGFNLSLDYWGTTVTPRADLHSNLSDLIAATPSHVLVWPGAAAGDEYDPIPTSLNISINPMNGSASVSGNTSGPTLLYDVGATHTVAVANEAQFVALCESIHCTAILQVPGEVNNTTLAQQVVYYTEHILNFTPAAWEIGNEPELWKDWNCPWDDWTKPLCTSYNNKVGHNNKLVTPLEYAYEVQNYTQALRLVDPHIQILGVPATGRPENHLSVSDWVNATVSVNLLNPNGTPNDNLAGIAFHDYPAGKFGVPTLAQFYGTIASPAGLAARITGIRSAISNETTKLCAGLSCEPVPVYVTEVGSSLSHWNYSQYGLGFPGALDLAAQIVQSISLNLTNLDLYAAVLNTTNSWFPPSSLIPRPDYTLYSEVLPHLGTEVYPTTLLPPNSSLYFGNESNSNSTLHSNLYAVATVDPAAGNRADLMAVDLNLTTSVNFTPQLPGIGTGVPVEAWYWNGTLANLNGNVTAVATTVEPTSQYFPGGLPQNFTMRNQSLVVFEAYPSLVGVPVTFPASGLPVSTRWYVRVDNLLLTSNNSGTISTFLPPGTYTPDSEPVSLPLNGVEKVPVERLEPFLTSPLTVGSVPTIDPVNFSTQWSVNVTSVPDGGGNVSPTVSWLNASATAVLTASANPGEAFSRWTGYGPGSYTGKANPVTIAPTGPITEKAFFTPAYFVTFLEQNLPAGTPWTVTIRGTAYQSSTASLLIAETNGTYGYEVGAVPGYRAAPENSSVSIDGANVTVEVTFIKRTPPPPPPPSYWATFEEIGLPTGTNWSVSVRAVTEWSSTTSLAFLEKNGTYGFQVGAVSGYRSTPKNFSFSIEGSPQTIMISFIPQYHPPAEFAVTFNETGLPAGIDWTVTVRNVTESASGSAIVFLLVNATYGFQVGAVSGYRSIPTNASVMVNGAPLTTVVAFLQRTPPAAAFPVDFVEAGLPSGTAWSVTVRNATYSSVGPVVSTVEINGSFGYRVTPILGFAAHPQHAGFEVQGAPVQVSVNFTQVDLYWLVWNESGLGPAPQWSVTVDGASYNSGGAWTMALVSNGTHTYRVHGPEGFAPTPASGSVSMNGTSLEVRILFRPINYTVTFSESGLPGGSGWRVTLWTLVTLSTDTSDTFEIRNGSFAYSIVGPHGYSASPREGTLSVSGGPLSLHITFAPIPDGPVLPSDWTVAGTAVSVAAVLAFAAWGTFAALGAVSRKRGRRS